MSRLREDRPLMQVLLGPRQVGKTTAVLQACQEWSGPTVYASADAPAPPGGEWIEQAWNTAQFKSASAQKKVLLVLDEIQKVHNWAEHIKKLWDQSRATLPPIHLVLCGSSSLQIQQGLTESLAGRFEMLRMPHWSYNEMKQCFGWDLEQYIVYGGYPGSASMIADWQRWTDYIQHSLVETAIGKDILLLHRVEKPALLRQLYALSCDYAGQIVSYQKLLGQLQDAGNTTTLAHYQHLLEGAYLLKGLQKWHGTKIRTRASSPKWQPRNTALVTSQSGLPPDEWRADHKRWGRLVEISVGAHLLNKGEDQGITVYYWRERNQEVDFVIKKGNRLAALEVKSSALGKTHSGLSKFQNRWPEAKAWIVGPDGLDLADFLSCDLTALFA
ncbi:MAG: ATP-binding protein [Desulfovermiculus sp.]|nr:ATP-binding protein [Desulfovermiculus sp.]